MRVFKNLIIISSVIFLFTVLVAKDLLTVKQTLASSLGLPEPGQLLSLSKEYSSPILKGLKIDPSNPLSMEFIFDSNDARTLSNDEAARSISYFMAALTTPNDKLWVNLSPYEKDRVIDATLAETDLGKDMLAQDYILKQISASLTSPDTARGKEYWAALNSNLGEDIPVMDKIWIEPGTAEIFQDRSSVLITEASLKIKTEHTLIAEHLAPVLEMQVNTGKHFMKVRQIYHALILARWFKESFVESFYSNYFEKAKIDGIALDDKEVKDKVFNLYVQAFEKGVYKTHKNIRDRAKNKIVKKQYFAGGETFIDIPIKTSSSVQDFFDWVKGLLFGVKVDLTPKYDEKLVLKNDSVLLEDWLALADLVSTDTLEAQYANSITTKSERVAIETIKSLFQPVLDYNPAVLKKIHIKDVEYLSKGNNAQVGYFKNGDKEYVIRQERIDLTKVNATKKIAENLRGFIYQKEFAKKGLAPDVLKINVVEKNGAFWIEQLSYYGGRSYDDIRQNDTEYDQARALKHFRQLVDIVSYAASRDLVLADFKPSNVIVDENDDLRVIDFPMIQKSGTQLVNPHSRNVYSTRSILDPSLFKKIRIYLENDIRIDPNSIIYEKGSDIFALGSLLYFVLTGQKLFVNDKGEPVATFNIAEQTIMNRLAQVGEQRLVDVLQSMLNYDVTKRPSIKSVEDDLQYILNPRSTKEINEDISRVQTSIDNFEKTIKKLSSDMSAVKTSDKEKFSELHKERLSVKQGLDRFKTIKQEYEENLKYSSSSVYGGIDFETVNIDISGTRLQLADVDIDFKNFSGFGFQIDEMFEIEDPVTDLTNS